MNLTLVLRHCGTATLRHFGTAALISAFLSSCASVPVSGRRQFLLISQSEEMSMGESEYQKVLKGSKVVAGNDSRVKLTRKIGERLAIVAAKPDFKWEFNVIEDDKVVNAFCLPGGKVAVYTGLISLTKTEPQLATVISHEIAHALARHGAERISQGLLAQLGGTMLSVALKQKSPAAQRAYAQAYGTGAQLGILLPFSRKHEEEADYIGLILMAKAGFDPQGALEFWLSMEKASPGKDDPLSKFLSTHPSHGTRIERIKGWMAEAQTYYQQSALKEN